MRTTPDPRIVDEVDELCRATGGLTRQGDYLWSRGTSSSALSYPEGGLSILASVEHSSYWFAHRNKVVATLMRRYPPGGTLYDIGGGNGVVSAHLAMEGLAAVVIEPDSSGARRAAARGLPTIEAAFQDLALPAGAIDAAGMFDVLEHIEEDDETLERLHDALKTKGMLYIAVPALPWLWSDHDTQAGHFRRYTRTSLSRRLRRAGFTVLFSTYFFAALVPAIFLMRAMPGWLGMRNRIGADQAGVDHNLPDGAIGTAIVGSLNRELRRLNRGHAVPLGSSCIVAARKD